MKIYKILTKETVILLLAVFSVFTLKASQVQAAGNGSNFSVSLNDNANQVEPNKPYFYQHLDPNQETQLSVNINNTDDEDDDFTVYTTDALTNSGLSIDYSPVKDSEKKLINPKLAVSKMSENGKMKVTVPANSTKEVSVNFKAPAEKFNGKLLGSIYVQKDLKEENKNGFSNQFSFVTPVYIRQNGMKPSEQPDISMDKVKIKSESSNNQVIASLRNKTNSYIYDATVDTKVYKDGKSAKPVLNQHNTQKSVAPNSKFDYLVPLDKSNLASGDYTFDLKITDSETNKVWHFKKHFKVSRTTAVKSNSYVKEARTVPTIYWVLAIMFAMIIVLLLVLIFKRKKK